MMNILNRLISHHRRQNRLFEINKNEVEQSNLKLSFRILIMGCLFFIPFLVISFTVASYRSLMIAYFVEFCVLALFLLLFRRLKKAVPSAYLIYFVYATLVAYSIITSAYVTPQSLSVIILFFLFQIPIVVMDKSWRVNLVVVAYALCYLLIALPKKAPALVADEILNCMLFTVFGIGLGQVLRAARLDNFELRRQALLREKTDYLTGLDNRKALFDYLSALEKSDHSKQVGLMMIDIDHFKLYNDSFGHQSGDDCLKKISGCFKSFGQEFGVSFYRYGGEEFVGICGDCPHLLSLAKKLNSAVSGLNIPHITSIPHVTISIGVCSVIKDLNYSRLLSEADIALYTAKTSGRNRVVAYEPGMKMPPI